MIRINKRHTLADPRKCFTALIVVGAALILWYLFLVIYVYSISRFGETNYGTTILDSFFDGLMYMFKTTCYVLDEDICYETDKRPTQVPLIDLKNDSSTATS